MLETEEVSTVSESTGMKVVGNNQNFENGTENLAN